MFQQLSGHLRRWSIIWPKLGACGRHTGKSPSGMSPNSLTAKGWWSQGAEGREDDSLPPPCLPPAAAPEGRLHALEQPVAWNLWDLVVSSQWYSSPCRPWHLCWQEHKINTLASTFFEISRRRHNRAIRTHRKKGKEDERIKLRKDTLPATFPWNSPRQSYPGLEAWSDF